MVDYKEKYELLKRQIEALLYLLDGDLDDSLAKSRADELEIDNALAKEAFENGVRISCINISKKHIEWFKERAGI